MSKLIVTLVIAFSFTFPAVLNGQEAKASIESLAFLSGCWEISNPEKKLLVSEQWMSPAGDAMLGMARSVKNGKMGSYEFLRIVQDHAGIHYIAKPSQSKSETSFKLVKWAANEAVFENPAHDFPQRIIYKLASDDSLDARIEGTMNGKSSGMNFSHKRARCR